MKALIIGMLTGLTLTAADAANVETDTLLVTVVTSSDTQKQLQAMELTLQAVQRGERAHVMLCGSASGLAREQVPDDADVLQREVGNSPKQLLARIVADRLVSAEVCSIQTVNVTGLMAGISPADPADMAKRLFFAKAKYGDNLHVVSF